MDVLKNTPGFLIFPEFEEHKSVVDKYGGAEHCRGAGFVKFSKNKDGQIIATCYGDSYSLKIGVGEFDSRIITQFMEGND